MGLAQQNSKVYNLVVAGTGVRLNCYPAAAAGTALTAGAAVPVVLGKIYQFVAKATILVPFRIVGFALDTPSGAHLGFFQLGVGTGAGALPTVVTWEFFMQIIAIAGDSPEAQWAPMAATVYPNTLTDAIVGGYASAGGGETSNGHVVLETAMGN